MWYYQTISSLEKSYSSQALDERKSSELDPSMGKRILEFDLEKLPNDPGLRPKISDYHPSDRHEIRRYYLQKVLVNQKRLTFHKKNLGILFVSWIWIGIQIWKLGGI